MINSIIEAISISLNEEFGDGYEDENFDFIEEKTDDIEEEFIVLDDEDLYDF